MPLRSLAYLILPALVVTACSSSSSGDDDDTPDRCDDPRYGDGVCDPQISCDAPDIDCFQTFASDTEAADWWRTRGSKISGVDAPTIAETDPRFVRMRKALDDGWTAFKRARPVGELAADKPALVVIDLPQISHAAFVLGDPENHIQPFAVMVETPSLDLDVTDDAVLGVMMHELQHAVGLHTLGDTSDRLRAFYVAPGGSEPLGRDQRDDADLHMMGDAWRTASAQIGPYSQVELGGFPRSGIFATMLATVIQAAVQQQPANCMASVTQLGNLDNQLSALVDPLDSSLRGDLSSFTAPITSALVALRDDCLGAETFDLIDVGAEVFGVTREQFRAQLTASDLALVEHVPFVDGLVAIVSDRRTVMRDAEDAFSEDTGEPWAQLRYFSFEEDADDVSAFVMTDAGKDPASLATFFLAVLPPPVAADCSDLAAHGLPGYGVDLTDEHHATCWRVGHIHREPASDDRARARRVAPTHAATRTIRVPVFPRLHKPSDNIAD